MDEPTPQYGFAIDHRTCIGCHACTVACKSENEVPVGSFRTWVKYQDKGTFPAVRRHFTVLRCNHCDAAPCVEICPVTALHKRPDAIVDLDRDICIGCRACMQACPYDALYLNEDTGTAEKCHYCAHRTELGLEPACVVVCPTHSIISGDVSDPQSEIARRIADNPTSQRRLDKQTRPRVWYVDALEEGLEPGRAVEPPMYLWSDRRTPQPTVPVGLEPPGDLVTAYDVAHPPVWSWHIWVYLVTKNIAAGVMLLAPILTLLGLSGSGSMESVMPEIIGLVFLGLTTFLLVHDIGRPERFLRIVFAPNTSSWLVKGAWILMAFGALMSGSLVARIAGATQLSDILRWIDLPVALMASGYSAFLFRQCRARDLWLARDLFWHLIAQAALLGTACALVLPSVGSSRLLDLPFVALAAINAIWILAAGRFLPETDHARRAHRIMMDTRMPGFARQAFLGAAILVVFGAAVLTDSAGAPAIAARWGALVLTTFGMLVYERCWIASGQEVPIS